MIIKRIRELPNSSYFFIQPEKKAFRDSIMSNISPQPVFPNSNVIARTTLPKTKSKPSFVIVNVHHSIQGCEIKQDVLSNTGINVVKVSRIISRASRKPKKRMRKRTGSPNVVLAAERHGVKICWLI